MPSLNQANTRGMPALAAKLSRWSRRRLQSASLPIPFGRKCREPRPGWSISRPRSFSSDDSTRWCKPPATREAALFSISATHLDQLLNLYGKHNLIIVCDRQGGREHYGSLLRLMFPEWSLEIDCESDGNSEYRLHQDGHTVRIIFREKAEVGCMSVAVASMLSKYLREAMMRRFNAFWQNHLPGVEPTAGYYGDGTRFLVDIEAKPQGIGNRRRTACAMPVTARATKKESLISQRLDRIEL